MKAIFFTLALFIGSITYAQSNSIKVQKQGDLYHVTLFHDNGEIAQVGYVTSDKKLHGIWTSFDTNGQKTARGVYDEGKKKGRWLFWKNNSLALTQVEYGADYRVASIEERQMNTQLADNDNDE